MVIVTAADSSYFLGLFNLVGSIHYWSPGREIVIYDLGMTTRQKNAARDWDNTILINDFLHHDIPHHCKELKKYAWKPLVLHDAIEKHEAILWIDAGSDLRSSIDPIRVALESDGHFFVQGQDLDMTQKSHEGIYKAMHTTKEIFTGKPHFAGGLQGYIKGSQAHKYILNPYYTHALDERCISPPGSNLSNHRYDQTLLSILLYQCDFPITPQTQLLAAGRNQLHEDPLQESNICVYIARCSSIDYIYQLRDKYGTLFSSSKQPRIDRMQ